MKIDQALNLVTTIDQEDSIYPIYVYVTPFPYEVVEQYHEMLGATLTKMYQMIGDLGAVRTAGMMLRKAEKMFFPEYEGPGFFDEIMRLTQVAVMQDGVWKKTPLESALKNGLISTEEWRDVEGEVSFFIVSSAIQKRKLMKPLTGRALAPFGAQLTPSNFTAFLGSLEKPKAETESQQDQAQEAPKRSTGSAKTQYIPS